MQKGQNCKLTLRSYVKTFWHAVDTEGDFTLRLLNTASRKCARIFWLEILLIVSYQSILQYFYY